MYTQYGDAGRAKEIQKLGRKWIPLAKETFPRVILGMRAVGSSAQS